MAKSVTDGGSGITGGGGGAEYPPRLLTGKFLLTYREKRGKEKKGKGVKLRRKEGYCKREGKLQMESGKVTKWGEDHFFKTTKICFGLAKWKFSTEKKKNHFTPGEKNQEKWLCTPPNSCYALGWRGGGYRQKTKQQLKQNRTKLN